MKPERLTEKTKPNPIYDCNYISLVEEKGLLDKLGELEDIEQELGVDLVTLFKALKDDVYVKSPYDVSPESSALDIRFFKTFGWFFTYRGCGYPRYLIKDYGKTWALTKEELQK